MPKVGLEYKIEQWKDKRGFFNMRMIMNKNPVSAELENKIVECWSHGTIINTFGDFVYSTYVPVKTTTSRDKGVFSITITYIESVTK